VEIWEMFDGKKVTKEFMEVLKEIIELYFARKITKEQFFATWKSTYAGITNYVEGNNECNT
jgi:hypothetical protein